MIEIKLDLHRVDDALLLDPQDVYEFIGEDTHEELLVAMFVDAMCKYLNYPCQEFNEELKFSNGTEEYLRGWISGFQVAWGGDTCSENGGHITIQLKGYRITFAKPFAF